MSLGADPVDREISESDSRWQSIHGRPTERLLQLALLRELYGKLHAMKSSFLARKDFAGVRKVDEAERSIQAWAFGTGAGDAFPRKLADLVRSTPQSVGRADAAALLSAIPPLRVDALGRDRLERGAKLAQQGSLTDRPWELLLIAEASRLGCEFWSLNSSSPIADAERAQEAVVTALWPHGILLSTRTLGIHSDTQKWEGQWQIAMEAGASAVRDLIPGQWTALP